MPAREVERAELEEPAAVGPHPVRDRVVDERRPEQDERDVRRELHALGERARDERRRDDREHHLERDERERRDRPVRPRVASPRSPAYSSPPMSPWCVGPNASEYPKSAQVTLRMGIAAIECMIVESTFLRRTMPP